MIETIRGLSHPTVPLRSVRLLSGFQKRIRQRHSLDVLSVLEILGVKKRALTLKCCGNDERVVEGVLHLAARPMVCR